MELEKVSAAKDDAISKLSERVLYLEEKLTTCTKDQLNNLQEIDKASVVTRKPLIVNTPGKFGLFKYDEVFDIDTNTKPETEKDKHFLTGNKYQPNYRFERKTDTKSPKNALLVRTMGKRLNLKKTALEEKSTKSNCINLTYKYVLKNAS